MNTFVTRILLGLMGPLHFKTKGKIPPTKMTLRLFDLEQNGNNS